MEKNKFIAKANDIVRKLCPILREIAKLAVPIIALILKIKDIMEE